MSLPAVFNGVRRILLDTAPVIYFVENSPRHTPLMRDVFADVDKGAFTVVSTPITLAECLVAPLRTGNTELAHTFIEALTTGPNVEFLPLGRAVSEEAARMRAQYGLTLADAFQIAAAAIAGCEAILTNDNELKRIPGLIAIVLDDVLAHPGS